MTKADSPESQDARPAETAEKSEKLVKPQEPALPVASGPEEKPSAPEGAKDSEPAPSAACALEEAEAEKSNESLKHDAQEAPDEKTETAEKDEKIEEKPSEKEVPEVSGADVAARAHAEEAKPVADFESEAKSETQQENAPAAAEASDETKAASPWRRRLLVLAGIVVFLAAGGFIGWQQVLATLYEKPAAMTQESAVVAVLEGDSAARVLGRLADAGITVPAWQAKLLVRLEPALVRRIHVGRFRFTRGMTPHNILDSLSARVNIQIKIGSFSVKQCNEKSCFHFAGRNVAKPFFFPELTRKVAV